MTLIALAGASVLTLAAIVESGIRQRATVDLYRTSLQEGYLSAWRGIVSRVVTRLETNAEQLTADSELLSGLWGLRPRAVNRFAIEAQTLLARLPLPAQMWVVNRYEQTLFQSGRQPLALEDVTALSERVLLGATTHHDIVYRDGRYYLVVAFPLVRASFVFAVGMFSVDLSWLTTNLARATGDRVAIVNAAGASLNTADGDQATGALLPALEAALPAGPAAATRLITLPDNRRDDALLRGWNNVFSTTFIPFAVANTADVPRLVVVRDITDFHRRFGVLRLLSYGALISVIPLFFAALYWYLRRSFHPLNRTVMVLNALASGNTEARIDLPPSDDEIGRLLTAVEQFRQALLARQKLAVIRQELDAATRIQRSIHPHAFPSHPAFEVYALLQTAQEVGGDFYDFFELTDGRYGFVIADVSGKGMGAALFMAVARTVMRTTAFVVDQPGACLSRVNDFLSVDNDTAMFATLFYGLLDPATGRFTYANAGHNLPYLMGQDCHCRELPRTFGVALGAVGGLDYGQGEVVLTPGDRLVLYTDGVTEAIDEAGGFYGDERFAHLIQHHTGETSPRRLVDTIAADVASFAGRAPQADDITLMVIHLKAIAEAPQQGRGEQPQVADERPKAPLAGV